MQTVNTGHHFGRASTFFMTMIELKSADPVCIFPVRNSLSSIM